MACDSCERLATELEAERADLETICGEVSIVYDTLTGGRFSKPNTIAGHVIEAADRYSGEEAAEYRALLRTLFMWDSAMDRITFLNPNLTDDQEMLILTALAEVSDE